MNLIEAHDLYKSFGSLKAVNGVSLAIAEGEIYGMLGPDGAGKTTTLRLLCGALQPSDRKTTIHIAGIDLLKHTEQARAEIGYLPQRFSLYEELTVLENLRFFAEVRGLSPQEWKPRSMDILDFVGLIDFIDRRAGNLSGGMKQKLGLAAALVHNPKVLLLDEPTTGVDPVTRQDFWQLIIRLVASRNNSDVPPTVLICTPYMDEAARCNRLAFMRSGQLIIEGSPSELRAQFAGKILELVGEPLTLIRHLILPIKGIQNVQMFGDRLHVRVNANQQEQITIRIKEKLTVSDINNFTLRPIPPHLEDVFMELVEAD
jgi:ABC-2 type transport system ATP-binding protein